MLHTSYRQSFHFLRIRCRTLGIKNTSSAKILPCNHLIQLGHKQIAHIAGPPTIPLYKDRLNGYISALTKHNIPIDLEMVSFGESSIQHGYDGMKNLLESGKSFSAVFTAGDIMAVGAIKAIKDAGLRVPQDCAVVGFDDIEISAFCDPPLTTVRQPRYQIGETAFKMLLKLMNKSHLNDPQVVLDYDIVIRESCGYHPKKE
ncbi:MAG: substrate-binding domain-containing protein [Lachnospiraceae bacterium]